MAESLCLALAACEGVLLGADEEVSSEACLVGGGEDIVDCFGEFAV